jgi:hypothetical protein
MRSDANRAVLTHHPLKDSIKLALRTFPQSLQFVWTRLANSASALGQVADEVENERSVSSLGGSFELRDGSTRLSARAGCKLLAVSLPSFMNLKEQRPSTV